MDLVEKIGGKLWAGPGFGLEIATIKTEKYIFGKNIDNSNL